MNASLVAACIDKRGNVWMLGNQGIARYRPETGRIENYNARQGVLYGNFRQNGLWCTPDGQILAGSDFGFNYFDPDRVGPASIPLKLAILRVESGDSVYVPSSDGLIKCSPKHRNLVFHFMTPQYSLSPFTRYRYRLVPNDTGFVYAGRQPMARYTNLLPGKYSFIVEATIDGTTWYRAEPLAVILNRGITEQPLFWLAVAAILFIMVYSFLQWKRKSRRQAAQMKRHYEVRLAQVQMNMLRAQMNPHFIYNSLNSINHFILKNDRENASGYLTKFSRLIRLILENSRNEWVSLQSEVKALELYLQLECMRLNHAFTYRIVTDKVEQADHLLIPPLLLQPFIENAIWHGLMYRKDKGGHLEIAMQTHNGRLNILITDNGIGREAAKFVKAGQAIQKSSHGIGITADRLKMINDTYGTAATLTINDLYNEAGLAAGTAVNLSMNLTLG
jgi:hypothetical protein